MCNVILGDSLSAKIVVVDAKVAITSEWPLLSCARFTRDIYAKCFLFLLRNEEVEKFVTSLAICGGNLLGTA